MLDDQGDPPRLLNMLFQPALQELRARHPELDIKLDYKPIPYLNLHTQFLKTITNQTPVDILTVDQIWLGEFAEKGLLTDLTEVLIPGEDRKTGIKQTGMVEFIMTNFMAYGQ